jgi:hypothetical protein
MGTSEIKLHNILREKFDEQDTVELVECINAKIKLEVNTQANIFLTKEDKIDIIDRINKSKTETIVWIVGIGVLQFILGFLSKLMF